MSDRGISLDGTLPDSLSDTSAAAAAVQVEVHRPAWDACRHRRFRIEASQRLVKCMQCGMLLDPVWCLQELVYHYETSPNQALAELRRQEQKEADRRAVLAARRQSKPAQRQHLQDRQKQELERAAHNAHLATLHAIRSGNQVAAVKRIEAQLRALKV